MGTHGPPLFAEVVLHAYKAYFIQWLPKIKKMNCSVVTDHPINKGSWN
jgi:hypothetical protein